MELRNKSTNQSLNRPLFGLPGGIVKNLLPGDRNESLNHEYVD